MSDAAADARLMDFALRLGRRALGHVAPNPAVGCVIASPEGRVLGIGWTAPGGRPHAEAVALADATARFGEAALRGATAYATLEPCSHRSGRGAPCADALVAAGIARAVVALHDPYPAVDGRGLARLRAAGLQVELGLGGDEAAQDQQGFLTRVAQGRPMVTLKLAASLDGRIALANGESRWITGPEARAAGHALRADHDAILVGIGTALADDPQLTCRLPGYTRASPVRIVIDSRLRLGENAALRHGLAEAPLWLAAGSEAPPERVAFWRGIGATVALFEGSRPEIGAVLRWLGRQGVTRLLVEGGPTVAASLLAADLVDRLALFQAPLALGGDARGATGPLALERLALAPRFEEIESRPLGADRLISYRRRGAG